jgi:UDP-N-acetylmuramate--alanine ligase
VLCFQPHRYTRTHRLYDAFLEALMKADMTLLLPIYHCGETPIAGVTSQHLVRDMLDRGHPTIHMDPSEIDFVLSESLHPGDVLLCQGAGDIGALLRRWVDDREVI